MFRSKPAPANNDQARDKRMDGQLFVVVEENSQSNKFLCFWVPGERRCYTEPLIFENCNFEDDYRGNIGTSDSANCYHWCGRPTRDTDFLSPNRPQMMIHQTVTHSREYTSRAVPRGTQKVELRNKLLKDLNRGGNLHGTSNSMWLSSYFDFEMFKVWCCDSHLESTSGVFRKRQVFMTVLFLIGQYYPPDGEWEWEKSQCFSASVYGGPWRRGEVPSCAHAACGLDGDGEALGYRYEVEDDPYHHPIH
jgi:hypothetical protein